MERVIDEERIEDVINIRSPAYKARKLGTRKLTKKQAINLMMEDPNLIRRPLVIAGRKAVFGYDPDEYDRLT